MKVAFEGIGSLSKTTISNLREIKRKEVDALLQRRSQQTANRPTHSTSKWDNAELEGASLKSSF